LAISPKCLVVRSRTYARVAVVTCVRQSLALSSSIVGMAIMMQTLWRSTASHFFSVEKSLGSGHSNLVTVLDDLAEPYHAEGRYHHCALSA
jgi:hypothetical protein